MDQIASYLKENLTPGDTVQPLDWNSGAVHAMLLARAPNATPFIYDFHFYHHVSNPTIQKLRKQFLTDLYFWQSITNGPNYGKTAVGVNRGAGGQPLTLNGIQYAKGFGFLQSKPRSALSPVLVTPDELGAAWRDSVLGLPLRCWLNGERFGEPDAGVDMQFKFGQADAAAGRPAVDAARRALGEARRWRARPETRRGARTELRLVRRHSADAHGELMTCPLLPHQSMVRRPCCKAS